MNVALQKTNQSSKSKKNRYIYFFGNGKADGNASMSSLLGGKGANLAEMTNMKMPVPPGFTITTEVCTYFYQHNENFPPTLIKKEIPEAIRRIEKLTGKKFGDPQNPLLISVRSGAKDSMPGMMDTILNIGLNDDTVEGLAQLTSNPRFAYDCYRRLVQMYGNVVLGLKPADKNKQDPFEEIIDQIKHERKIETDSELNSDDLKSLVSTFKKAIIKQTGKNFPEDPLMQLNGAIGAVFASWNNSRAITYRQLNRISSSGGTACNVQAMAFGNLGENSGTGVAFTRDASTGENIFYGEYLMNAQGEDVVAGTRTPLNIDSLKRDNPVIYSQLEKIRKNLERHYRDMMDLEFTIENGTLYILQCRVGKRTGFAAIKIALDMLDEKLINEKEALRRIHPEQLNQLLRPIFNPSEKKDAISSGRLMAKGLDAGPGAASGKVFFNAIDADKAAKQGERVILVRLETSPEDIQGMAASEGILTARGGMTSHAALVARQMGKVCVAGCGDLDIDSENKLMTVRGKKFRLHEGDSISIDGSTGEVFEGEIKTKPSEVLQVLLDKTLSPEKSEVYQLFNRLMKTADKYRKLKLRTNADQPDQANTAIAFGAEGIGLCRSEHMFFSENKIDHVRAMILANNEEERKTALLNILPEQRQDFYGLFAAMNGFPVTIRLLDPPLHEFLPRERRDQQLLAQKLHKSVEEIQSRISALKEENPMLGFRGCRLGILYPEITEMQVRAILEAALTAQKNGFKVFPEIMVPLVGDVKELINQKQLIRAVAMEVFKEMGATVKFLIGTMIEVPRAALLANEIATEADFFSFGTNDLTQMTLGISRDDSNRFMQSYKDKNIFAIDPFQVIDREGVGKLMEMAVEAGRKANQKLKLGICGEHGGETSSIDFCSTLGLSYVSCSPYRVPIARLAAARAAITP